MNFHSVFRNIHVCICEHDILDNSRVAMRRRKLAMHLGD